MPLSILAAICISFVRFPEQKVRGDLKISMSFVQKRNRDPGGKATPSHACLKWKWVKGAEVGWIARLSLHTTAPFLLAKPAGAGAQVRATCLCSGLRLPSTSETTSLPWPSACPSTCSGKNPTKPHPCMGVPRSNELPLTCAHPLLCLLRAKLLSRIVHPWAPPHPLHSFPAVQRPGH